MKFKVITGLLLTLFLASMLTIIFTIQPVKSDYAWTETIYIRADGSVYPDTAPISSIDSVTYTLTDNIVGNVPYDSSAIIIERNNIVVDGAGYTLQETGDGTTGIYLSYRSNVTIKNMEIKGFFFGIWLEVSSNNIVSGNNVTNNHDGVLLRGSHYNSFYGNNITNNYGGILLSSSNYNSISRNNITNIFYGITLGMSSNNTISGNNIANNYCGIAIDACSNNNIYHNNIINNTKQVYDSSWDSLSVLPSVNIWDDGYPSGGNYWSDYIDVDQYSGPYQNETGSDSIWDHPYVIDEYNQDNYPIVPEFPTWTSMLLILIVLTVTIAVYKRK